MRFRKLASEIVGATVLGASDPEVTGIAYDSNAVNPGDLFVAMQGSSKDGHDHIPQALGKGAVALVTERALDADVTGSVPCAVVGDGRLAMGEAAAALYNHPSRKLRLIGVTGTSGKTSVTHIIQTIFAAYGTKAGLIGTLGARSGDRNLPTAHTTPESADVQRILAEMVADGVQVVAMEASSHGLFQGRTHGCEFDCGVFTNVARDHLDFHKTADAYLDAKLILFREYPSLSEKHFTGIVNADDLSSNKVIAVCKAEMMTFGVDNQATVTATRTRVTDRSVEFDLSYSGDTRPARMNIGGYFNIYNALAASCAAIALGLDIETVCNGLAHVSGVPGRFEFVDCGQDFGVIVDYAHTPDELENVLSTASKLIKGRLIAVFGCGGDRDKGKRPIMGEIAQDIADIVVVTSDNPRTENPVTIIKHILAGMPNSKNRSVQVIPDRREAIKAAVNLARAGDIVVIAGKGHEDYQIFADHTIHFDDREVATEILRGLGS